MRTIQLFASVLKTKSMTMITNFGSFSDSPCVPDEVSTIGESDTLFDELLEDVFQEKEFAFTDLPEDQGLPICEMTEEDDILDYLSSIKPKPAKRENKMREPVVRLTKLREDTKEIVVNSSNIENILIHYESDDGESPEPEGSIILNARKYRPETGKKRKRKMTKNSSTCSDHSDSEDESKSLSKAAIQARKNRQKKKQKMESLENSVEKLREESYDLKSQLASRDSHIKCLEKEIEYLRSVLTNQSAIANILKSLPSVPGMYFLAPQNRRAESLSDVTNKEVSEKDENSNVKETAKGVYVSNTGKSTQHSSSQNTPKNLQVPNSVLNPGSTTGGICLHLANNVASLEYCSSCAKSASENWKKAGDHNYFKPSRVKSESVDGVHC